LQTLQQQQQALVTQQAGQMTLIRQLVRAAYREGSQSTVKLVLNQNDPAEAARMLYYYQLINQDRLEKVREYQLTLTSLSATERELESVNRGLSAEQLSLDAQLAQLEQERLVRQQALAELDSAIDLRGRELEGLLADREALQTLIDQVQQAMETAPVPGSDEPFAQRKGQLPLPGEGSLLARFNEPYGNGDLQRQGILIGGTAGSPVRAVHGGRVVFADWLRGSGLLIILDHGDGYLSLYGHNETLTRERGSRVEAGSVIATTGNSGGQRETGIYFEIRYNGRPQNPAEWLAPGNF
jgi:septal ring factor EnvC (AmiA/AmiB activator)